MGELGQRIVWIAVLLAATSFVIADHAVRPALDHDALEVRRASGAYLCAPCGQACTPPQDDA